MRDSNGRVSKSEEVADTGKSSGLRTFGRVVELWAEGRGHSLSLSCNKEEDASADAAFSFRHVMLDNINNSHVLVAHRTLMRIIFSFRTGFLFPFFVCA